MTGDKKVLSTENCPNECTIKIAVSMFFTRYSSLWGLLSTSRLLSGSRKLSSSGLELILPVMTGVEKITW